MTFTAAFTRSPGKISHRTIAQRDNSGRFSDNPATLSNPDQHAMPDLHLARIRACLLSLVPENGAAVGNTALRRDLEARLRAEGLELSEDDYWSAHAALIAEGMLMKGQGRGGSVRRTVDHADSAFALEGQTIIPSPEKPKAATRPACRRPGQPRGYAPAPRRPFERQSNSPSTSAIAPGCAGVSRPQTSRFGNWLGRWMTIPITGRLPTFSRSHRTFTCGLSCC